MDASAEKLTCTRLVYVHGRLSPQKDVVDLSSYVSTETKELAIDTMENGLEEVSFSRVFAVKQLKETYNKGLINVPLGEGCLKFR